RMVRTPGALGRPSVAPLLHQALNGPTISLSLSRPSTYLSRAGLLCLPRFLPVLSTSCVLTRNVPGLCPMLNLDAEYPARIAERPGARRTGTDWAHSQPRLSQPWVRPGAWHRRRLR